MSPAERARRYRARRRERSGTAALTLHGPGNTAALKHGARSERVVDAAVAALPGDPPWLANPMFSDAADRYRRLAARELLIADHVDGMSAEAMLTPIKAGSSPPAEIARQYAMSADRLAAGLAITPAAAAKLGRHLAGAQLDLAREWMLHNQGDPSAFDGDGEDDA